MRLPCAFLALALLALPAAQAGDDGLAGYWKVTLFDDGQELTLWLLKLETKQGKLTGSVQSLRGLPPSTLSDLVAKGERLDFTIQVGKQGLKFEGKLSRAAAKMIRGSLTMGARTVPAVLEATTARNPFELNKQLVAGAPDHPRVFDAVLDLIKQATKEKATVTEVQAWTETALRAAEKYGQRWHRETALGLAEALLKQEGLAPVALVAAQAADKLKGEGEFQFRVLATLAKAFKKAGQADRAKVVLARLDKLENDAHEGYKKTALPFMAEKFAGRKAKSNRAVLVELFTGAQCPPCVAADLAFDGIEKTYQPADVVLLQYHLHVPGADPLTNPDAEARQEYYHKHVRGTPAIMFNGKPAAGGGGGRDGAQEKYLEYRKVIDPLLEQPAALKLQVRALRNRDQINIRALASGLDQPGEKVRLRLAVVEDWVRYKARNGLGYHSRVVRALVGGPDGLALTKKNTEHTVVLDLEKLESKLHKYLDDYVKNEGPFPDAQRPMRLRDLSVVAFVQDDDTNEVLQAVEVPVKTEE